MPASKQAQEHAVERAAKIFTVLKQIAAAGEICPTNDALGERFGVRGNTVSRSIGFLEANGMIEVARENDYRVITICATGHRTASRRRAA